LTNHPLGIVEGRPRLVPYDHRWPDLFSALRGRLNRALGDHILSVHHVGSTAVPGLAAKPVLDVLIGVSDLQEAVVCIPPLATLGFEYGPDDDIAERHWFRGRRGGLRIHHLSLAEPVSTYFVDALAFRDALRSLPELAREYTDLKTELVARHVPGRALHTGKTEFVRRALEARRTADRGGDPAGAEE